MALLQLCRIHRPLGIRLPEYEVSVVTRGDATFATEPNEVGRHRGKPLNDLLDRALSSPRGRPDGRQSELERRDTAPRRCQVARLALFQ